MNAAFMIFKSFHNFCLADSPGWGKIKAAQIHVTRELAEKFLEKAFHEMHL